MKERHQQSQTELEAARAELERVRAEAASQAELARTAAGALHTELARSRQQLEAKT